MQADLLTFFKTFIANIFPEVAPDTFRTWNTCKNNLHLYKDI